MLMVDTGSSSTTELIMEGALAIVVIYLDEAAMSADLAVAGTTLEQTLISGCVI